MTTRVARAALVLAVIATIVVPAPNAEAIPKEFRVDRIARVSCSDRACITEMQFAPNGDLYFNLRAGSVRIIRNGRLLTKPVAQFSTTTFAEGGLLGLALDPNFASNKRLYVFRTTPNGARDMVERIDANGARKTLMDLPAGGGYHHGGILAFGPDEKLYVSNGEAHRPARAQDPRALGGKIYRINSDGSIPDDNPFGDSPTWSYGHRNTFGLAFDPASGRLWESENGPSGVDDEVNVIGKGGNYGWPNVQGRSSNSRYINPVQQYSSTIAPTMMAFADDAFPESYRGNLFMGAYVQGAIYRFVLNRARTAIAESQIFHSIPGVVGMTFGPDGLYFSTDDSVWRIRPRAAPKPTTSASPVTSQSLAPTDGPTFLPSNPEGSSRAWWLLLVVFGLAGLGVWIAFAVRRRRSP